MKQILTMMAVVLTAAISVSAQGILLGPQFGYTVTVSTPDQVSQEGAPSRFILGLTSIFKASERMEVRVSAGYRMESGGFASPYQEFDVGSMSPGNGRLDVVEPGAGGPSVVSTVETQTVEVMAGLHFPVAELDTAGSRITIGLSVLGDYMLSGTQSDDYSNISDYTGETPKSFDYVPHVGFGAAIGAGLILPMGESSRLGFDLQYVFREPREINVEQNGVQLEEPITVAWLVGRGLRLSLYYAFAL